MPLQMTPLRVPYPTNYSRCQCGHGAHLSPSIQLHSNQREKRLKVSCDLHSGDAFLCIATGPSLSRAADRVWYLHSAPFTTDIALTRGLGSDRTRLVVVGSDRTRLPPYNLQASVKLAVGSNFSRWRIAGAAKLDTIRSARSMARTTARPDRGYSVVHDNNLLRSRDVCVWDARIYD